MSDSMCLLVVTSHIKKIWKKYSTHTTIDCFRAFNTAAYGPKCLPFLRDNSRLSCCKANLKKPSC